MFKSSEMTYWCVSVYMCVHVFVGVYVYADMYVYLKCIKKLTDLSNCKTI